MPRQIYEIAQEIRKNWKNVWFGAQPYLLAMEELVKITDDYGMDDAQTIIIYFLGNAQTWRGETARRIKKELKDLAGIK
jgi:hypothetical protein